MNLDRKLVAYTAAAAAVMAGAAESAEAANVSQPGFTLGSGSTNKINFDSSGAEEYHLGHRTGPNRVSLLKDSNALSTNGYTALPGSGQPVALSAGTLIGPASTFSTTYDADLANEGTGVGNFTVDDVTGNPQYLGLKFQLASGGATHYRWGGGDTTQTTHPNRPGTALAYDNTRA